jgi:hypothetical protein
MADGGCSSPVLSDVLREEVVQRLFAASLWVETAARESEQPEVAERLGTVMSHLDGVIEQIRPQGGRGVAPSPVVLADDLVDRLTVLVARALDDIVPPSREVAVHVRASLRNGRLHVDVFDVLADSVPFEPGASHDGGRSDMAGPDGLHGR